MKSEVGTKSILDSFKYLALAESDKSFKLKDLNFWLLFSKKKFFSFLVLKFLS